MKRLILSLCLGLTSCAAQQHANTKRPQISRRMGIATVSYYSCCGRTASGEKFLRSGLTAANKTLPFGTIILFANPANGKSATVRVNDRGPFVKGRLFDVSEGAAIALGFREQGTAHLQWEIVK